MKKKSAKRAIYCGILSTTLLGSSLPLLSTQVHAEEKTKALGGSVGDLVWEDTNQNGKQDAGEKGIEGITIELYRADGSKVGEQKTDQNGFYQFNALQEGDYFAHIVIPQDQYK
ncbi:SdrD B-like domain-containing protein, partial [Bacillus cereus]